MPRAFFHINSHKVPAWSENGNSIYFFLLKTSQFILTGWLLAALNVSADKVFAPYFFIPFSPAGVLMKN